MGHRTRNSKAPCTVGGSRRFASLRSSLKRTQADDKLQGENEAEEVFRKPQLRYTAGHIHLEALHLEAGASHESAVQDFGCLSVSQLPDSTPRECPSDTFDT